MALFHDDVLLQDSERAIFQKLKRLRDAVSQAWRVGRTIRENTAFPSRLRQPADFLIVVLSRELLIGGGEALKRLFEDDSMGYPDEKAAERLPLSNCFFEHLMGCVRTSQVELSSLLQSAAAANAGGGGTAKLFFSDFLRQHPKTWPQALMDARAASEKRIFAAFDGA